MERDDKISAAEAHELDGWESHVSPKLAAEVEKRLDPRDVIVGGLREWAQGNLTAMAAVKFVAATDEPLDRVWVVKAEGFRGNRYYFDWDLFTLHGGTLSGGEYATWALAQSLHRGELDDWLWRLDPDRTAAFAEAVRTSKDDWPL